jgi:CubicO group peptidase (beta-lactamase class C family)
MVPAKKKIPSRIRPLLPRIPSRQPLPQIADKVPVDALNAALEKSFAESGAPGVVAAVQTPEDTWVETRGVADLSSEEPMAPDVHHRIGSVTKTFTISLLLQAAAEGLLSLDDTIENASRQFGE